MTENRLDPHQRRGLELLARLDPPPRHAVVLSAGGVTSTVVAHWLVHSAAQVTMLTCTLSNQAHHGVECATATAALLNCEHRIADLSPVARAVSTSHPDIDTGSTASVLARISNGMAIMLDLGVALAIHRVADAVLVGIHADDTVLRPECDPRFLDAVTHQATVSNTELSTDRFRVAAPLTALSGDEVVLLGAELGVPYQHTWSCHRAGPTHCGHCPGCRRRRGAFTAADLPDPTEHGEHYPAGG